MIQVNRIYLIFNRLVTKKFLVDTSELVEFIHRTGFHIIGNVDVGFHSLVVAMSRPFHHYLCRNTESQSVTDESPSPGMGTEQCVFGCNGVYTAASFVVGFTYRLVDFGKFAQFLQIVIHLLVAYDRESLVPLKFHTLVFCRVLPCCGC